MKKISMLDVTMGEKVFVKFEGAIHKVKVVGFKTQTNNMCGGNDWADYFLYFGKGKTRVWTERVYRTVNDAVNGDRIKPKNLDGEQFTKMFMRGMSLFYDDGYFCGYVWQNNSPMKCTPRKKVSFEYLNGKGRFVGEGIDPKVWFQTAEECKMMNTPKIVYLDDEE